MVRVPLLVSALVTVMAAGCVAEDAEPEEAPAEPAPEIADPDDIVLPVPIGEPRPACDPTALACRFVPVDPVDLRPAHPHKAEPSVVAYGDAIAVTSVRPLYAASPQLASYVVASYDGGATWIDLPSPADVQKRLPALEGDLVVDDEGTLYFVDMTQADVTFSRWAWEGDAWAWSHSRPIVGTPITDDRPWLAAHGDGQVYLLTSNGVEIVAPNHAAQPGTFSRWWMQSSSDGGTTWGPPHGFADSLICYPTAQPGGPRMMVACLSPGILGSGGAQRGAVVHVSEDRGATFERHLAMDGVEPAGGFLVPSAIDASGRMHVAGIDAESGDLRLAWSDDGVAWAEHRVPVNGSVGRLWLSAHDGLVAASYYWSPDASPGAESPWYVHVRLFSIGETVATAEFRVDAEPAIRGATEPEDFFQNQVGPGPAVHLAYERSDGAPTGVEPGRATQAVYGGLRAT